MAHDQNQHKELLTIVREPPGPGISSLVDVIALHGLFSTFDKTWRGLEDECAFSPWLEKLPFRARIFSYAGVMSLSSEQGMLDKSALEASAKDLLAEISKKTEKKRPIVFLCHNIAGVLVKELLWIANHDKRYFHIALDTKAVVCLGLLDTSSSWDEGLLRLVLATTDSNTNDDPRTRRAEITEVIRNGASALRAATMRFEMIKHKYRIVSACEVAPEDGGGVPVGPILEHDADLRILMPVTHDRLPLSPPPDSVINFILRATEASTQDYQYDAMACRQRLATQYEYDEDVGKLSLGIRSPIVSPLCEKLAGQRSGLLTIYGSAGSGKSVLASQIAEIVLGAGNNIIVLSFAFSVADYRRSSYRDLLLLFLVQLLYREDSVFNSIYVRKVYSRLQKDLDLSWANLHLLLCAMLSNLSKKSIVCVIDAIDECDEESRVQLVGDFKRMALEGPVECMVFLTSRPSDSVTRLLGPFKENSNVDLDKNKDHVRSRLLERDFESEQLQDVRRRLDEEKAAPLKLSLIAALGRMEELSDIPNRYNSIYKRIIARIDAPPAWLEAVLLCLAFAERPLTVAELAGAIGVDYCSQTLDGAELTLQQIGVAAPKQLRDDLELVAGSLVCIRKNVVSLVHGTLRDTIRQDPGILKKSNKAPVSNNDQTVTGSSRALHISLAILSAPELSDLKDVATRSRPFDHLCSVPVSSQAHNFARYAGSSLAHQLRGTNAGDNLEKATQDTRDVFSMFWDNVVARSWWIQTFTTFQREAISSSLKEPLCFAAFVGHQSAVKSLLLEAKYDIQIIKLALQVAISSRNAETTRLLLTISQDLKEDVWQFAIESSCDYGRAELLTSVLSWRKEVVGHELSEDELHSCLRLVAKNGHWHIISVLREAYPQMMSAVRRETLVSLIEEAASEGRDGVISVLLSMDESRGEITELGSPSRTTTMQQAQGQTMTEEVAENNRGTRDDLGLGLAMIKAARFGNAAVVRLLASTCNSAPEYREDKTGMTALHSAAVYGNTEALNALLDRGSNIEAVDNQDATPLLFACLNGHVNTVHALLKRGANPDHAASRSAKSRALHLAARRGRAALVRILLEAGASENARLDEPRRDTPLHLAVAMSQPAVEDYISTIQTLLEFGADVNLPRGDGSTALHLAINHNHSSAKIVETLVNFGADFDLTDKNGRSPLYYAVSKKKHELARIMWNHFGREKVSVLFNAAGVGNTGRVQQLLDAGCDRTERDTWGRIAYDVGVNPKVRALLAPDDSYQDAAGQAMDPDKRCPGTQDGMATQRSWLRCVICRRRLNAELFYHCCACSGNCNESTRFDICGPCFSTSDCKVNIHGVLTRFVGGGLTSYAEFSPDVASFGLESF